MEDLNMDDTKICEIQESEKCFCEYPSHNYHFEAKLKEKYTISFVDIYEKTGEKGTQKSRVESVAFLFCPKCGKRIKPICPTCGRSFNEEG
jgi:hypothetical protein